MHLVCSSILLSTLLMAQQIKLYPASGQLLLSWHLSESCLPLLLNGAGSADSTFAAHHPGMMSQYPRWYLGCLDVVCEQGMSLLDKTYADAVQLLVPKMGSDRVRDFLKELQVKQYYRCGSSQCAPLLSLEKQ
jgi:hypothetical protein